MKKLSTNPIRALVALALVALMAACSTTRKVPADDLLYTGVKKIVYNTPGDTVRIPASLRDAVEEAVDVAPNNYLAILKWRYPFPLGLWVYNNWPNPPSGFRHWLYNLLVEEPVLMSDVRPQIRTRMIDEMLDNNGFFSGSASYEFVKGKNPKKAKVVYTVNTGNPYPIDSLIILPDTCRLNRLIDSIASRDSYLHAGPRFCTDSLSAARIRITNALRNRGYYFFRPEYIEYLADSIMRPGSVVLKMDLAENAPDWARRVYRTGKVQMIVRRYRGHETPDTIEMPRATLIQMMPSKFRHKIVNECVTFRPGRTFSVRDMNRTQTYLSRLGIFSSINIEPVPDTTRRDVLDVLVDCKFDAPLEASLEVNASSKSNSYIGPGASFGVTNHNMFGGGEQLSVKLNGAYEWQTGHGNKDGIFNSYEVGITGSLAFPRLLAPKFIPRSRYQLNWTRFQLNADLLNRPHYFKMAQFNVSVNYDWRLRRHVSNTFTPFKLTYTNLMHTTEAFDSVMAANPAVALSFQSQFIPQMIYNYTYDRRIDRHNSINWQFTVQEAGNIFWGVYQLCGKHGEKKLFGTPFSQFVKAHTQFVWNRRLRGDHYIVSRVAVGAEHAYGNSSQVPYSEQFYCGGANSVRAFTVRSIGPGSYRAPQGTPDDYFDQTGTFIFEANVEYRFPIAGALHGAVFLDSGNVWLLKADPARPGGTLRAKSFLRDLATGTGFGLRFDMSMLVVRADLGIGIHAPYNTGHGGYYNMESFGKSLAFHLAIGYPF